MGVDHYPTPWASLKYDTGLGGYLTNVTRDQLDKAARFFPAVHLMILAATVARTHSVPAPEPEPEDVGARRHG